MHPPFSPVLRALEAGIEGAGIGRRGKAIRKPEDVPLQVRGGDHGFGSELIGFARLLQPGEAVTRLSGRRRSGIIAGGKVFRRVKHLVKFENLFLEMGRHALQIDHLGLEQGQADQGNDEKMAEFVHVNGREAPRRLGVSQV